MKNIFSQKWKLTIKVIPYLIVIIILKYIVHYYKLEFLSLNALFTAIISANIFLIGFLITGVLSDYKESEKIPGDIANSLETLSDEGLILHQNKKDDIAKHYLIEIKNLSSNIILWFNKEYKTTKLLSDIQILNNYFYKFESITQANFISRLKQEQSNLRKQIIRIHHIRETSFNSAGYAIAEIISFILCIGLIFIKIDPYYESIFFVTFVSFIMIYMVLLIKDLDNPFGYYNKENLAEEVSLKPVIDFNKKITKYLNN